MRISDWSSDVCSSDLAGVLAAVVIARRLGPPGLCIAIDFDARFRAGEGDALKRRGRRAGHQADQHQQGRGSGTEKATNGHESDPHWLVFKRSEEHTSELQSLMRISYAVFCLKKKKKQHNENVEKTRVRKHSPIEQIQKPIQ